MTETFATNFSTLDWIIVVIYLLGVGSLGMIVNRYIHSVSDFMVGGRGSGTALNTATYIGTSLGLVTIMYASIDGFSRGFSYMMVGITTLAGSFFIGSTGFVVSRLRAYRLVTIPEFYDRRFDKRARVTAGFTCALAGILNMGLFPKMGATFITYSTGLGEGGSELMVNIVTSLLIVMVLIYTIMGGMVSVIVTDYVQFVILAIGLGVGVFFCLTHPLLGWDTIVSSVREHRGIIAFNPLHPDSYGWGYAIWMLFIAVAAGVCWGPEASRSLTSTSPKASKRTFLLASPTALVRLGVPVFWAMAAFCYFSQSPELSAYFFPDGLSAAPDPSRAAQAMPLLIGKVIPTGLLGILVAGLMAAFMSTHDSYLLCWASVIARDIIAPLRGRALTDREQIRIARITVTVIGIFLLVWGIWYEMPESVWTYMAVTGNIYLCGSATVLIGGMYWRRASSMGAFVALLGGLVSIVGVVPNIETILPWLTPVVLGLGNYALCALLFVVVSLLFPDKNPKVPEFLEVD